MAAIPPPDSGEGGLLRGDGPETPFPEIPALGDVQPEMAGEGERNIDAILVPEAQDAPPPAIDATIVGVGPPTSVIPNLLDGLLVPGAIQGPPAELVANEAKGPSGQSAASPPHRVSESVPVAHSPEPAFTGVRPAAEALPAASTPPPVDQPSIEPRALPTERPVPPPSEARESEPALRLLRAQPARPVERSTPVARPIAPAVLEHASVAAGAPPALRRAEQLNRELKFAREEAPKAAQPAKATTARSGAHSAVQAAAAPESAAAAPEPAAVTPTSTLKTLAQVLPDAKAEAAPVVRADHVETTIRTAPGVARGLAALASSRGGTLQMRLDPPSLGMVRLEMAVDAGRVSVRIAAASESARVLLSTNIAMLRTSLEERGLAVDRLIVESGPRSAHEPTRSDAEHHAREGRDQARQDASQGRSRGHRGWQQQRGNGSHPQHAFTLTMPEERSSE